MNPDRELYDRLIKRIPPEDMFYEGDDLGIEYKKKFTRFRVWSPAAQGIELLIFENEFSTEPVLRKEFAKSIQGTWFVEVEGDLAGKYFCIK